MGRIAKDYTLTKRRGSPYWYAKVEGGKWWSTKTANYPEARSRAKAAYDEHVRRKRRRQGSVLVRDFAADFYDWDTCTYVRRKRDEGKRISRGWCEQQVRWRKAHLDTDPLADMPISEVIRKDILDFRARLRAKALGMNTVNKVVRLVKTLFAEAVYEGVIDANPAAGIGAIVYDEEVPDPFTRAELRKLFPARLKKLSSVRTFTPWEGLEDYAMFLLAASTGMRRSEILGLRWRSIDWKAGVIHVTENWKKVPDEPGMITGDVKWGGKHATILMPRTRTVLRAQRAASKHAEGHHFVFCGRDGLPRGETWWREHFQDALGRAKIKAGERKLVPHSLRHTVATMLTEAGIPDTLIDHYIGGWKNGRTREGYVHAEAMAVDEISKALRSVF